MTKLWSLIIHYFTGGLHFYLSFIKAPFIRLTIKHVGLKLKIRRHQFYIEHYLECRFLSTKLPTNLRDEWRLYPNKSFQYRILSKMFKALSVQNCFHLLLIFLLSIVILHAQTNHPAVRDCSILVDFISSHAYCLRFLQLFRVLDDFSLQALWNKRISIFHCKKNEL